MMAYDVSDLVSWFEEAEDVTYSARQESERARDYVDGLQWTEAEQQELKKRGQAPIVINRIRRKVQWLRGLEIKQRTDPKAFPRTPDHEQAAEASTDALRFVADNTNFDRHKSSVWENMLIEGHGGVEIVHRQKRNGEVEIVVKHYPWDRLFYDPYSRRKDFSDARYLGAVVWMDKAELLEEYPGKKALIEQMQTDAQASGTETYDDRPRKGLWYDAKRNRIRVVLMWHKSKGVWKWCKFVQKDKLEEGESPYVDEDGESVCPLIMQSLYVGRDNDRYGVVRDMFGPQDEVNKRRSKALHLLSMRQVRVDPAVQDRHKISRELAKPDGIVEAGADEFEILPTGDMASGQVALLQEAKAEIDMMGANSALEGETGESSSGRAVLARQQGGMIEIAPELDELRDFTQRCFEAMWDRIKQFWTEEKWIRVTDDERNVRFASLNRPVTFGEMLSQQPPEIVQQVAVQMQLAPNDPRLGEVVSVENDVTEMMVDIIIEESPDRITLAGETFEALMKYGPIIPPDVLIEADPTMPSSKKERLLQMMQERQQQAAQQPPPELAMKQAEMQLKGAELQQKAQQAQGQLMMDQAELQQDAREAEMKAAYDAAKLRIEAAKVRGQMMQAARSIA
jgi:hypothetical protein